MQGTHIPTGNVGVVGSTGIVGNETLTQHAHISGGSVQTTGMTLVSTQVGETVVVNPGTISEGLVGTGLTHGTHLGTGVGTHLGTGLTHGTHLGTGVGTDLTHGTHLVGTGVGTGLTHGTHLGTGVGTGLGTGVGTGLTHGTHLGTGVGTGLGTGVGTGLTHGTHVGTGVGTGIATGLATGTAVGTGLAHHNLGNDYRGTFVFRPLEGRFTKDKDIVGRMDPYVKIKIGWHSGKSSIAKSEGTNPVWGDVIPIEKKHHEEFAKLKIKDKDRLTLNDKIGETKIPLADIAARGRVNQWFPVYKKEVQTGEILLDISFEPLTRAL